MTTQFTRSESSPEAAHESPSASSYPQVDHNNNEPLVQDQPTISNDQSETVSINVKLRNVWEEAMRGFGATGTPKKKAAVLMISWDESVDDMDTSSEVEKLGNLFREKFRYEVITKRLSKKRPGHQINTYLSSFVENYDDESTLLIVYYAGHGMQGKPGELHFTGRISESDSPYHTARNSIPWHDTEFLLKKVSADVLLIFDCCFAGNLTPAIQGRGRPWPTRSFEYLAACPYNELTHPPGRKSFTSALIWALEQLLETRGKFTTLELQQKIMKEAPNFPRYQIVEVQERGQPCDQRLVLAPLPDPNIVEDESDRPAPLKNFIDLRVWYQTVPNEEDIEHFAIYMRRAIADENITASNIAWVRFDNVDPIRKAVDKWRRLRATSSSLSLEIPSHQNNLSHLQALYTPPPSEADRHNMGDSHNEENLPEQSYLSVTLENDGNKVEIKDIGSEVSADRSEEDHTLESTSAVLKNGDHWTKSFTTWVGKPAGLLTLAVLYVCIDHLVLRPSFSFTTQS